MLPALVYPLSMRIGRRFRRLATCFAVSPERLVTAAHAVFDHHTGRPFEQVRITAADGPRVVSAAGLWRSPAYDDDAGHDWGIIHLDAPLPLPDEAAFTLHAASDAALSAAEVFAAGYPGQGGLTSATLQVTPLADRLLYEGFGGVGTSGAPLWIWGPSGERLVVGIHSRTHAGTVRAAMRIRQGTGVKSLAKMS